MKTVVFYGDSDALFRSLQKQPMLSESELLCILSDEELTMRLSQGDVDLLILQKRSAAIDFDRIVRQQQRDARLSVLLVPYEDELSAMRHYAEENGLFVVPQNVLIEQIETFLSLLCSFQNKTAALYREKEKLSHKLMENRLTDRAKCILIQHLKLTEAQAHKYIERQAMDLRISREKVAQIILQTYEQS